MAYAGTTSTSPNPPVLVTQGIAFVSTGVTGSATQRGIPRQWVYVSTHVSSDVEAVNFFTDGQELGMAVGDQLIHIEQISSGVMTSHRVVAVGSTTTDLGVGTTIGLGA